MAQTPAWIAELWEGILAEAFGEPRVERAWGVRPALGRVTVTRPELLKPFAAYNEAHPDDQVRPFNFVSVAYPKDFSTAEDLRLFAPLVSDPARAFDAPWVDMRSGKRLELTTEQPRGVVLPGRVAVKSYGEVAREYAAHPEAKFGAPNGGPCLRTTTGTLTRRHVRGERAEYIGKEGNLLDRRAEGAGLAGEVQAVYEDPEDFERYIVTHLLGLPRAEVAARAGISERALRAILSGRTVPRARTGRRLVAVARQGAP